jgi:hypothetical protein
VDTTPIVNTFNELLNAGAAVSAVVSAFFVMLAGYQYMTAGGSLRSLESAKSSFSNALVGLAIVILCKVIANLVGGALGAPAQALGPLAEVAAAFPNSVLA